MSCADDLKKCQEEKKQLIEDIRGMYLRILDVTPAKKLFESTTQEIKEECDLIGAALNRLLTNDD